MKKPAKNLQLPTVGWREWVRLEELGLPNLKAKVDTGARTSALHALNIKPFTENGEAWVSFQIHPLKAKPKLEFTCKAKVHDQRTVKDSSGNKEKRYVIKTDIYIGPWRRHIELTLTNRRTMNFVMLLGREALAGILNVDCAHSFVQGEPTIENARPLRRKKTAILGK